ncbi:hypothetical protein [Citricoccus nitrophenolicus]|uniref:hypothetical protein n=1 Tax=Citricoccus nitrophenolicus TaxID=863575 RepID=UPI0039B3EAF1
MTSAHTVWRMVTYRQRLRANIAAELGRNDSSQTEAAAHLDMTPAGFTNRMTGKVDFRTGELMDLAAYLKVPYSTLTAGLDELVGINQQGVSA